MNNLTYTMLNERKRLNNDFYKYGFIVNTAFGHHMPNGGWEGIGINEECSYHYGSWSAITNCVKVDYSKTKLKFYFQYNAYGSNTQYHWIKPYTKQDIQEFGYTTSDAIVYGAFSGLFDAWYSPTVTISMDSIKNNIINRFKQYPNGYYGPGSSYSEYSRGNGSNGTPTFSWWVYITVIRSVFEDVHGISIIYYIIDNFNPANNALYSPVKEDVC